MKKLNQALLVLNLFFLQSYLIRFDIFTYPSNLQEVLIGINFLLLLMHLGFKNTFSQLKKSWILSSIIALTTFSVVATLTIKDNIETIALLRNLKFVFFASLLYLITITSTKNQKQLYHHLEIMSYGALSFGIFSVIYNLLGFNLTHDLRLNGPLDSALYLAFYLSPFLLFNAHKLINKFERKTLASVLAFSALIIATKSMGAIAANAAIIGGYLIWEKAKFIKNSKASQALIAGVLIIISASIFYTKILPTINTNYSSLDERGQIWATTTQLLSQPENAILGLGFGQFETQYSSNAEKILGTPPLDPNNQHPHNIFLLFFSQFGIIGLAFISYLTLLLAKNIKAPTAATLVMIYFFIHGLIDSPYFKNEMTFLFILFAELALNKNYKNLFKPSN